MKKEYALSEEFNLIKKHLAKKKEESIKELEALKKRVLLKINSNLDILYKKRDYISEVLANKKELKKLRIGVWKKFIHTRFWTNVKYFISMPFIYGMIVPAILMHAFLEIYHQVCFRIYRIPRVDPHNFFIFDRALLPQLNWFEKFNCAYCSYFNCLISYTQEIAARTERYWCPIKHARRMVNTHSQYEFFVDYSDAENLRKRWKKLRKFENIR